MRSFRREWRRIDFLLGCVERERKKYQIIQPGCDINLRNSTMLRLKAKTDDEVDIPGIALIDYVLIYLRFQITYIINYYERSLDSQFRLRTEL